MDIGLLMNIPLLILCQLLFQNSLTANVQVNHMIFIPHFLRKALIVMEKNNEAGEEMIIAD